MLLKGKKPTNIQKRFKALFFGNAGVGKTTAAIQFPTPYLIDTERGAENDSYTHILEKQGGVIYQTSDFDEIINEIKALATEKHEYKTLIIDPLTTVYNNLLDNAESKVGSDFGRHYNEANKEIKKLLSWLLRLDMNVIITSHSKNEYGDKMNILRQVPDCYKKLDYLFDLVLEIRKRGEKRIGVVAKTRIEGFKEDEIFEFSYSNVAKKYGKEVLEKDSENLTLSSVEQVRELTRLINILKIPSETYEKWLAKAEIDKFEDMDSDKIQKCIDMLQEKLK